MSNYTQPPPYEEDRHALAKLRYFACENRQICHDPDYIHHYIEAEAKDANSNTILLFYIVLVCLIGLLLIFILPSVIWLLYTVVNLKRNGIQNDALASSYASSALPSTNSARQSTKPLSNVYGSPENSQRSTKRSIAPVSGPHSSHPNSSSVSKRSTFKKLSLSQQHKLPIFTS